MPVIEVKEHSGYMVGDRVRFIRTGETGEVVMTNKPRDVGMLGVRFDNYAEHRHGLDGCVPNGYGWWAFPREIERE